ncbi:MAG: metallophosphoesterase [Candidatus Thorarchaeota archaeon]|jgi:protein phosphatase
MDLAQDIIEGRTQVSAEEIEQLTGSIRDLNYEKPNVVTTPSEKVFYVGDVHGDLGAAKTVVEIFRRYKDHSLVFMGDYADRGPYQVETVNFILALGLIAPNRVTILRGNHESEKVAIKYGFYLDVKRKHSDKVFRDYMRAFESLPIASLSENGVFSCHGGIPEGVTSIDDLQKPDRHHVNFENDVILQLVWNDPADNDFAFRNNVRGANIRTYGRKAFKQFSKNLNIHLMFRAHQVFPEGTQEFFEGKLVSVFSTEYNGRVKPKIVRLGKKLHYEPISL